MNRIIIVGNGFDLAHGVKTSYKDFIEWYFGKVIENLKIEKEKFKKNIKKKLKIREDQFV